MVSRSTWWVDVLSPRVAWPPCDLPFRSAEARAQGEWSGYLPLAGCARAASLASSSLPWVARDSVPLLEKVLGVLSALGIRKPSETGRKEPETNDLGNPKLCTCPAAGTRCWSADCNLQAHLHR